MSSWVQIVIDLVNKSLKKKIRKNSLPTRSCAACGNFTVQQNTEVEKLSQAKKLSGKASGKMTTSKKSNCQSREGPWLTAWQHSRHRPQSRRVWLEKPLHWTSVWLGLRAALKTRHCGGTQRYQEGMCCLVRLLETQNGQPEVVSCCAWVLQWLHLLWLPRELRHVLHTQRPAASQCSTEKKNTEKNPRQSHHI